jgi:hypothetical protein
VVEVGDVDDEVAGAAAVHDVFSGRKGANWRLVMANSSR